MKLVDLLCVMYTCVHVLSVYVFVVTGNVSTCDSVGVVDCDIVGELC